MPCLPSHPWLFRSGFLRALVTPRTRFSRVHSLFVLSVPRRFPPTAPARDEGTNLFRVILVVAERPTALPCRRSGRFCKPAVFASREIIHRRHRRSGIRVAISVSLTLSFLLEPTLVRNRVVGNRSCIAKKSSKFFHYYIPLLPFDYLPVCRNENIRRVLRKHPEDLSFFLRKL